MDVVMAEAAPAAKDSVAMATVVVVPGEVDKAVEARAVVVMAAEERWRYWEWRHISHRIHDSLRWTKMPCARVSGGVSEATGRRWQWCRKLCRPHLGGSTQALDRPREGGR